MISKKWQGKKGVAEKQRDDFVTGFLFLSQTVSKSLEHKPSTEYTKPYTRLHGTIGLGFPAVRPRVSGLKQYRGDGTH